MLLVIKNSEESWTSPDGQRTIWKVTDSEGNVWETMSKQIAQAIGQTVDVTTRVSDKGKTYLIKPPADGSPAPYVPSAPPASSQAPAATGGPISVSRAEVGSLSPGTAERIYAAVERFEKAVEKFAANTFGLEVDAAQTKSNDRLEDDI